MAASFSVVRNREHSIYFFYATCNLESRSRFGKSIKLIVTDRGFLWEAKKFMGLLHRSVNGKSKKTKETRSLDATA